MMPFRNAWLLILLSQVLTIRARADDAGTTTALPVLDGGLDAGLLDDGGLDAGALEAGVLAAKDASDAGDAGALRHPFQDPDNSELIDEYTSDHGCSCSADGRPPSFGSGLSSLAFAAALLVRARRRRPRA